MPYSIDALSDATILVAEDEYFLADAIVAAIRSAGGDVQGPFASVADSLASLAGDGRDPDAAALNVRLLDGDSYPLADELVRRGVPIVFATANSAGSLPERLGHSPLLGKPYTPHQVVQALARLVARRRGAPG